jgi:hypothetical protein
LDSGGNRGEAAAWGALTTIVQKVRTADHEPVDRCTRDGSVHGETA